MKKIKTIMQVITLACLVGCNTDDDSKSNDGELVSCRFGLDSVPDTFSQSENRFCYEMLITELEEKGMSVSEAEKECYGGAGKENSKAIFSNETCPSGAEMKCKIDGVYSLHYYGESFKNPKKTCGKL